MGCRGCQFTLSRMPVRIPGVGMRMLDHVRVVSGPDLPGDDKTCGSHGCQRGEGCGHAVPCAKLTRKRVGDQPAAVRQEGFQMPCKN